MTRIDPTKMEDAKEWAIMIQAASDNTHPIDVQWDAASGVILSLPDTIVDGDKLREVMEWFDRQPMGDDYETEFVQRLNALLPDPVPRTLADMTEEERQACQWMQATFTKSNHEHIITQVSEKKARLLRRADGAMFEVYHYEVIPLPDLPRMVWPEVKE